MANIRQLGPVFRALMGEGIAAEDLFQVHTSAQAEHVRSSGGVVIHIEGNRRPSMPGYESSAGVECAVGDWVITGSDAPNDYINRVVEIARQINDRNR